MKKYGELKIEEYKTLIATYKMLVEQAINNNEYELVKMYAEDVLGFTSEKEKCEVELENAK